MNLDELLVEYVDECQRRGVHGEVRAVSERREDLVARNGKIESDGVIDDVIISLTVTDGTQVAVLASGLDVDPVTVVAEGVALLRSTSGGSAGGGPGDLTRPDRQALPGRSTGPLADQFEALVAASALAGARECELRATQVCREVHYVTPKSLQVYPTTYATLVLRATRSADDGEAVHADRIDSGADLAALVARFDATRKDGERQLTAPPLPDSVPLPTKVVLDGRVVAPLVCLLSESLSAENVAQSRSKLAGRIGESVSSALVTLVDDPLVAGGPRHYALDDEGTAADRRTLIEQGTLRGFLGSRVFADVDGAAAGNARQPDATSAPRPAASNLYVEPAADPLTTDGPVLRIVQAHGMHLSNGITGEFSTGATGLVLDGDNVWQVTGLSLAGNVLETFGNVQGVGSELHWADDGESSFGAPDLAVTGLTIGR